MRDKVTNERFLRLEVLSARGIDAEIDNGPRLAMFPAYSLFGLYVTRRYDLP